eukprot:1462785-Alexandrium_andersonii.AAC.1
MIQEDGSQLLSARAESQMGSCYVVAAYQHREGEEGFARACLSLSRELARDATVAIGDFNEDLGSEKSSLGSGLRSLGFQPV